LAKKKKKVKAKKIHEQDKCLDYFFPTKDSAKVNDDNLKKAAGVFIDPGLDGTGVAVFTSLPRTKNIKVKKPSTSQGFTSSGKHWLDNACSIAAQVDEWIMEVTHHSFRLVFIEWPGLFSGSAVSHAAAAKGDLFKLATLIGCISTRLEHAGMLVIPLPVARWKGQLPKDVVRRRISRAYCLKRGERWPNHVEDAVGMGLAAQGKL
jgi:hypothetical protein